jgi:hypothetical protein
VSIRLPMHTDFLQQLADAHIVRGCDHLLLLSFVQGTLRSDCGRLSPSAALRSSCLHTPHALSDTTCTPPFFCIHSFASAVHKEMYQSPPEAIFSAVAIAVPWYGLVFQPFAYFFST